MSWFAVFILFSILIVAILVIPIIVFNVGKQKNWKWTYRWMSLLPLFITLVWFYFYMKTPSSFYEDEYKKITQLDFPESGEIQYYTKSSWTFNGDYLTAFVVEMEREDIRSLKKTLARRNFSEDIVIRIFCEELDYVQSKIGTTNFKKVYTLDEGDEIFVIAFLHDNETVLFYHSDI